MSALANPLLSPTSTEEVSAQKLRAWNEAGEDQAIEAVLPCNGSPAWARGMVRRRPLRTAEEFFAASDIVWASLTVEDRQEAFDSHPRIGEARAAAATAQSLAWSHGEQAAANPDDAARAALVLGNKVYEEKFGRIFIVCATGKSAAEMLEILQMRLLNDNETELQAAAEEQRKITQLRLRKWLGMAPAARGGGR